jgi:phosphonoacetaldehyde hydrolase
MKPAAIIFDWAGTMVDFGSLAPVIAMQAAFARRSVPLDAAIVRAGMGLAKRDHVAFILADPAVRDRWTATCGAEPQEADIDAIFADLDTDMREAGASRARLIDGAAGLATELRASGVRIASTTGYTRSMMGPILEAAAAQGYAPDVVVCAGETAAGRPSPLMAWKAMVELGVYPASAVVKVDDAPVGIAEGKAAGCFTVGVALSGNALGLDLDELQALPDAERHSRSEAARRELREAGADLVIDTVADLLDGLRASGRWNP